MHILILGGSLNHLGGVEAFCDRSKLALERRLDWRIGRLPTTTAYLTIKRLPILLGGLRDVARYGRQKPDVIWLQYVTFPDLVYLLFAKMLGFKVMVTPHLGSNWRSQSNPVLRALSGWALGFADRLALISPTQELEINLPAKIPRSAIRNFLPADILQSTLPAPDSSPVEMQLIHSGRLSEGKGTFMFVEVCERLRAAGVAFHARITGGADDATYDRLKSMIQTYGLGDQVEVLGRVSEDDLMDYLRLSDVLIHLSKIDSYPLIVLETTACCIFPICMELAGARDMIETFDGLVVSLENPVAETADFLAAADLQALRARSRIAAVEVRTEYEWDRCAAAAQRALEQTSGGRPAV